MPSTKSDRFKRLAGNRTRRTIKDLKLLGNLANTASYEYSVEDITKVFSAIEGEVRTAKSRFQAQNGNSRVEFSL